LMSPPSRLPRLFTRLSLLLHPDLSSSLPPAQKSANASALSALNSLKATAKLSSRGLGSGGAAVIPLEFYVASKGEGGDEGAEGVEPSVKKEATIKLPPPSPKGPYLSALADQLSGLAEYATSAAPSAKPFKPSDAGPRSGSRASKGPSARRPFSSPLSQADRERQESALKAATLGMGRTLSGGWHLSGFGLGGGRSSSLAELKAGAFDRASFEVEEDLIAFDRFLDTFVVEKMGRREYNFLTGQSAGHNACLRSVLLRDGDVYQIFKDSTYIRFTDEPGEYRVRVEDEVDLDFEGRGEKEAEESYQKKVFQDARGGRLGLRVVVDVPKNWGGELAGVLEGVLKDL